MFCLNLHLYPQASVEVLAFKAWFLPVFTGVTRLGLHNMYKGWRKVPVYHNFITLNRPKVYNGGLGGFASSSTVNVELSHFISQNTDPLQHNY